jgi:hypothetical protein
MFELLLCFALGVGLTRAGKARHLWSLSGGLAAVYLVVADTLGVLAARGGPRPLFSLFNELFLGPGSTALRAPGALPLPDLLLEHPLIVRGLRVALCAIVAWRCLHESSALNPLLPRARALDAIGMCFVGAAVIDAAETVLLVFAMQLVRLG